MTRAKVCTLTAGLLLVVATAACEKQERGFAAEIHTVDYRCENGERLQLKYVIPTDGEPRLATLTYRNTMIPMHQEPADSGVLFVADKGQPNYRWHTEGGQGVLLKQSLGDGQVTEQLKDCRSAEQPAEGD
ncbi:Membrane-bound lysozyme-inhibitor of c-type lysozyme [Microbulbifer donghaiensis]|uniref:Membrane-bound lysozyme-inhibitor of c-type lysozyme n=1 Tax=Microbulbifer donghaiensis TaxID=494016 RepID=A0A1M5A835_9GAMM|nr:MliC family protein [Microbulbifer donghaiensis]SHF26196.1 Membrane-bound lysozyme-inhibitor of c-type lysozyme [Microbulbifer donghaiensis]